jgi:hypothetical protein
MDLRGSMALKAAKNRFRIRIKGYLCIYCGERSSTDDHFPPKCHSDFGYLLPCCRECNGAVSTSWPDNFERRAFLLKDWLRHRYKHYLKMPDWTEKEIKRMGRGMRSNILSSQIKKKILEERIAWDPLSYLASIDYNDIFVPIFVERDFFEVTEHCEDKMFEDQS